MTVEVEFEDAGAAEAFSPPAWFSRELTGDARYSNTRLAMAGLPEPKRRNIEAWLPPRNPPSR